MCLLGKYGQQSMIGQPGPPCHSGTSSVHCCSGALGTQSPSPRTQPDSYKMFCLQQLLCLRKLLPPLQHLLQLDSSTFIQCDPSSTQMLPSRLTVQFCRVMPLVMFAVLRPYQTLLNEPEFHKASQIVTEYNPTSGPRCTESANIALSLCFS